MKILLINSNTDQLKAYGSALVNAGFEVLIANSFIQGINIAEKKSPDIVTLFIQSGEHELQSLSFSRLSDLPSFLVVNNLSSVNIDTATDKNLANLFYQTTLLSENDLLNLCQRRKDLTHPPEKKRESKILLVEDDLLSRIYYSEMLSTLKIDFTVTEGYALALNEFSKEIYDLVIADIQLKDGNGIDLLKEVRAMNNKVPFIFVSGYSKQEALKDESEVTCFAWLTKPIAEKDFSAAINAALGKDNKSKMTLETYGEKVYDTTRLFELLKNDKGRIERSLNEFLGSVVTALETVDLVLDDKNYDGVRPIFHDLLNLGFFYDAHLLVELIMGFRAETIDKNKVVFLNDIREELKHVLRFYQRLKSDAL